MKKIVLLVFLFCINSFGNILKENVMELLRCTAKKPSDLIFQEDNLSSNCFVNCWTEMSPTLLHIVATSEFLNAMRIISSNSVQIININTNIVTEIETELECEKIADANLKSIPPSNLLPILFQILEEGSFGTNEFYKYYDKWHECDEGEKITTYLPCVFSEVKIIKKQSEIYSIARRYIREKLKLLTKSKDWYITEIWAKHHWPPPSPSNFPIFWWYEGRKYATNIWNDFYICWQYEQARQSPREGVLDCLAKEIAELGISAIPLVKGAIDSGDNTLSPVLKALAVKLEDGGLTNQTFANWYSSNSENYILPACEGLETAKLRIADTNYVNELNGIFNVGSLGHETIRTDNSYKNYMQDYSREMLSYYTNRPAVPDYWYYKLSDDVLEFNSGIAFELDRNCTNFNPRYLTPSE